MTQQRPGVYTHKTPRVVAARKLTTRNARDRSGRFLVEGAQAVREALTHGASVHELFVTAEAASRHPDVVRQAGTAGVVVSTITDRAAELLSETITPQGIVAVCDTVAVTLDAALSTRPSLVAVLLGVADPGNAGTVLRTADAAGAGACVFAGDAVDPHNGKCVRSSTGSIFHLPIVRSRDVEDVFSACRSAGLRIVAAAGSAAADLDEATTLAEPTAWVFGNEAHGLPTDVTAAADDVLRVPIYGDAESLNISTAAAVCLYASARAQRRAHDPAR